MTIPTPTRSLAANRALDLLHARGTLSRAELADELALPRSTVTALVRRLVESGAVVEEPAPPGGTGGVNGRPAAVLRLADITGVVAGVIIDADGVRILVGNGAGDLLDEQPTDVDLEAPVESIAHSVREAVRQHAEPLTDLRALTVCLPGRVDQRTGRMQLTALTPDWVNPEIPQGLGTILGVPTSTDNAASLAAISEMRLGVARDLRDFLLITATPEISVAIVLDGTLQRGAHGLAGSIAHMQIDPSGQWCFCGNRGCLATVVSLQAIQRPLESLGLDFTGEEWASHPVAKKMFHEAGRVLGRAVAGLRDAINPEAVVLDINRAGKPFLNGLTETLNRLAQPGTPTTPVLVGALGGRADTYGAILTAIDAARGASGADSRRQVSELGRVEPVEDAG